MPELAINTDLPENNSVQDAIFGILWDTSPNCPFCGARKKIVRHLTFAEVSDQDRQDWWVQIVQSCFNPECKWENACCRLAEPRDFTVKDDEL